ANITPVVTMDSWTYGKTPADPNVSGNTGNGTVTYQYKESTADDDTYTDEIPTNAGAYTVRAHIDAVDNYNEAFAENDFTIAKASINPTVTMDGWTYGETASSPNVSGNTGNGFVTYQYKESTADDEFYTNEKPTDAGTYIFKANIADTANYNAAFATASFTIFKSNIIPTVTINSWTFGEAAQNPVVTGNTSGGIVTFTYKVSTAPDEAYTYAKPTNAGTYIVKANIADTANYNTANATASFTISQAAVASPIVSIVDPIYNGDAAVPTVTVKSMVNGGEITFEKSKDLDVIVTPETNAGDYNLQIKFKNNLKN
ncbi:MAG: hypothetical protein IIT49_07470, partial [Clostridia bacterium]|nr:hypothetical protein [Clostridia bacterium]